MKFLDKFQIGLVKRKKKKKNYVTNWRKNVKELENRTLCVTNLGKSAQGT